MNKQYLLLCVLGCLLFSVACHKNNAGDTRPSGSQTVDTGTIEGYVHVYDQLGQPVTTGLNKVQLTLKGGRTVNADDSGHYVFDKVTSGNYYLTISGTGLATTMVSDVNLIKDTTKQDVLISQAPTAGLTKLIRAYVQPSSPYFLYIAKFNNGATLLSWILFVDNQPGVSNTKYKLAYINRTGSSFSSQIQIVKTDLADAGILWGDSVYVAAYSYVGTDSSKYVDVMTGRTIYTAVGGTPLYDTVSAP